MSEALGLETVSIAAQEEVEAFLESIQVQEEEEEEKPAGTKRKAAGSADNEREPKAQKKAQASGTDQRTCYSQASGPCADMSTHHPARQAARLSKPGKCRGMAFHKMVLPFYGLTLAGGLQERLMQGRTSSLLRIMKRKRTRRRMLKGAAASPSSSAATDEPM